MDIYIAYYSSDTYEAGNLPHMHGKNHEGFSNKAVSMDAVLGVLSFGVHVAASDDAMIRSDMFHVNVAELIQS